jgi:hypothetical protein
MSASTTGLVGSARAVVASSTSSATGRRAFADLELQHVDDLGALRGEPVRPAQQLDVRAGS